MNARELSEAINELSDRYYEEAINYRCKKRRRVHWGSLAACLLLVFAMSVPALAAAEFDPAYNLLYAMAPSLAQSLKPVRMSSVDDGIQFEVLSALVEESEAKILVSVRDLDGDRIDETTDLYDSYSIRTPFDCRSSCQAISYDDETKTATFLISISQWNERDIVGDKITFQVREILSRRHEYDAALPDLDITQINATPDTIAPASLLGGSGADYLETEKDFHALKPVGILLSPVEGVNITAAGYVDGKLHIQVQYENVANSDRHGFLYFKNDRNEKIECVASVRFAVDDECKERYDEYVFDESASDLAGYEAYGYFVASDLHLTGNWSVTFPLDSVSR